MMGGKEWEGREEGVWKEDRKSRTRK